MSRESQAWVMLLWGAIGLSSLAGTSTGMIYSLFHDESLLTVIALAAGAAFSLVILGVWFVMLAALPKGYFTDQSVKAPWDKGKPSGS